MKFAVENIRRTRMFPDCNEKRERERESEGDEKNGKRRDSGVIFSASFDPYTCIMYMYTHIIAGIHIHTYTR